MSIPLPTHPSQGRRAGRDFKVELQVPDSMMIAALLVCGLVLHQGVWVLATVESLFVAATFFTLGMALIASRRMRIDWSVCHPLRVSGLGVRHACNWFMIVALVAMFWNFGFPALAALLLASRLLGLVVSRTFSAGAARRSARS